MSQVLFLVNIDLIFGVSSLPALVVTVLEDERVNTSAALLFEKTS